MMTYLLKASACIAVFYFVYLLVFKRSNRFQLNRAYLVVGVLLSFVVPIIILPGSSVAVPMTMMDDNFIPASTLHVADAAGPVDINYSFIWYFYFFGAAIALLTTLVSILKPLRLYWSADRRLRDGRTIIVHPSIQPFTFLGILFIRTDDEDPIIMAHEMVHIRQRHWLDLVLIEVAAVILWFNPVLYFYRRSIAIQHEYIADSEVTSHVPIETYLDCIARQLESRVRMGLVSSFNTRSIKQRIIMVTNTKQYSALRYVIVLPIVALLIMAFATRDSNSIVTAQNTEMQYPVDATKVDTADGAGFGKRIHPLTHREAFHTGVDFVLPAGNSVYAASAGVVITAENSDGYGNMIVIRHAHVLMTSYSHLEKILIKEGDKVERGQRIGTVGSTGLSRGPHLHFEVLENGIAVNPEPYLK
jgi:hypothetical protein